MRPLPDYVDGYGSVCESTGVLRPPAFVTRAATRIAPLARGRDKLLERSRALGEQLSGRLHTLAGKHADIAVAKSNIGFTVSGEKASFKNLKITALPAAAK